MQKINDKLTLEQMIIDLKQRIEKLERGAGRFKLPSYSSDPSNASNGEMYYNSTSNVSKIYEDGSWNTITTS